MNEQQGAHLIDAIDHILNAFEVMPAAAVSEPVFYRRSLKAARRALIRATPVTAVTR